MGLKFEHTDNLDKLFDSFAVDPKEKEREDKEQEQKKEEAKKQD